MYVYIGIIHGYIILIVSMHVVWWLGNETAALLQSHPDEALALLQRQY